MRRVDRNCEDDVAEDLEQDPEILRGSDIDTDWTTETAFSTGSGYGQRGGGLRVNENGEIIDTRNRTLGKLSYHSIFSIEFWMNLRKGFQSLNDSALFEYAETRELHVALASVGELFVLAGSLISGFSLSLLQIVDVQSLTVAWYLGIFLFVTLSFVAGIGSVCIAAMLFLGVSTTPISHIHLFASHLGSWILRPGECLCISFIFLGVAFALVAMQGPYLDISIMCAALVGATFLLMILAACYLLERIVCVRDFVAIDVQRERRREKLRKKREKAQSRKVQTRKLLGMNGKRASNCAPDADQLLNPTSNEDST
mmetsp:Transcript_11907/g.21551  ORF Transcript_11907/g.21551 Transcript_11907/m.21551 type:complete len:313 (+) Transcript_11907:60-998(+)